MNKNRKMKVPRGTTRARRRLDMEKFRAEQRRRRELLTGTVHVNAPSLQLLDKFVGKVG